MIVNTSSVLLDLIADLEIELQGMLFNLLFNIVDAYSVVWKILSDL